MKLPDWLRSGKTTFRFFKKTGEHSHWELKTPGSDGGSSNEFAEEASRVAAGLNCEEDEDGTGEPIASQQLAMARMFFIFVMRQRHQNFACVLGEGLGLGFYKDSRWAVLRKFSHGCRQLV